jgi:exopolysaccharide production protein ExoZ
MVFGEASSLWRRRVTPASGRTRELLSIQYLRAIAAVAVLIFHAADRAGIAFGAGAAGVDIFFVISGFIMWVISAGDSTTPSSFLARRAARIIPLYWLVTLSVAAVALAAPSLFPNLKPTFDHVVKSILFYPHADPSGAIAPLIVPGWTLDYEVFFYLIFAASLFAPARIRIQVLTAALGVLVLLGQVLHPSNPALATYTHPLLLEFLSGVWLAKIWADGLRPRPIVGASAMVLGFGVMAVVAVSGIDVDPVRLFVWGVPAFLIVAGAISLEPVRDWPIVKFLGDASYSIYLVHGLAIALCARILTALHISALPLFFVVCVSGGIVVGGGCYLFVEKPLLHLFHPSRRKRFARTSAVGAAVTGLPDIGAVASPPDAA